MCPNVFATTLFWYNITTCKSHVSILYALEPATQRSISLNIYKRVKSNHFSSVQFSSSVVSDSLWPHELQPGLPVHHQPPEFTQTHVHRVGHAVQPSHPLSSPSPPAPHPSQYHSLFRVTSSHEVAKELELKSSDIHKQGARHRQMMVVFHGIYNHAFIHEDNYAVSDYPPKSRKSSFY